MRDDVKKMWAEALRSGEYEQGTGSLHASHTFSNQQDDKRKEEFCCLGVLCELFRQNTTRGRWEHNVNAKREFVVDQKSTASTLPVPVQNWAGLRSDNPIIPDRECTLAGLNDNEVSFEVIADLIEENL